VKVSYC